MRKLFTLIAFLACFLGAKAANWVEVKSIDFSAYQGFPHYVMGYVPEWVNGVMTDFGGGYKYVAVEGATETSDVIVKTNSGVEYYKIAQEGSWHQYFVLTGIPTQLDGHYKAVAMVRASESCNVPMQMRWSWGEDPVNAEASIGTEWTEVEWEYTGIGGAACDLIAQPNTTATIEWQWIKVYEDQAQQRPVTWQEWLTNDGKSIIPGVATESKYVGDAETAWPAWALEKTAEGINANWRTDRASEICAWSLTMGKNFDDQCPADISGDSYRARPYPTDIEEEAGNPSNHVFAVHVEQIEPIGDDAASIAWSNQFWIESPQSWKSGTQVRIKFRYKAEHACNTQTQIHQRYPSIYLHWQGIGDVSFTEEWQEFDKTITFEGSQGGGWSVAFNLCADENNGRTPNVFYFDDLSWETMVLDEGYFVAASNSKTGIEYDFDNAIQFAEDEDGQLVATVGEKGKADTWVNEIMISTIRGNDAAFKGATLKPSGAITGDDEQWYDYAEGSLAKIKLPAAGVWQVTINTEYKKMNFVQIEGDPIQAPKEIVPNPTVVVVHGLERDYTSSEQEGGTGAAWDNQFFIVANRTLSAGEATYVEFKYKSSVEAKTTTQDHVAPGAYLFWNSIGDVNFTTEEQTFTKSFTVPSEADGMQSIAFNMAEIKGACDYEIKDIIWKLEDGTESLIDMEGSKNFYVKEGAGTDPYQFGTDPTGITNVVNKTANPSAIYNLAGQRVTEGYNGIVIKNGRKYNNAK